MSQVESVPDDADGETTAPLGAWQRFWRRHSPNWELPLSTTAAVSLHLFVILLLALGLAWIVPRPNRSPDLGVVSIDGGGSGGDGGSTGDGSAELGDTGDVPLESASAAVETAAPAESRGVVAVDTNVTSSDDPVVDIKVDEELKEGTKVAVGKANAAIQRLKDKLAAGLNAKGTGGGGKGDLSGNGSGFGGATGRGARQARWTLRFNTRSPQDYLIQMKGLGAALAFPKDGGSLQYYDLNVMPPTPIAGDISQDSRMYWMDESPRSVGPVTSYMNIPRAPMMVLFLPTELEEKMAKMEVSYRNRREEDIRSTLFEVVRRAGGFDVIVVDQQGY
jgi:hypothetical protein